MRVKQNKEGRGNKDFKNGGGGGKFNQVVGALKKARGGVGLELPFKL